MNQMNTGQMGQMNEPIGQGMQEPMSGGFEVLEAPFTPGMGPMIAVRTDKEAMMMDGIGEFMRPKRAQMRGEPPPRYNQIEGGFTVNKLE